MKAEPASMGALGAITRGEREEFRLVLGREPPPSSCASFFRLRSSAENILRWPTQGPLRALLFGARQTLDCLSATDAVSRSSRDHSKFSLFLPSTALRPAYALDEGIAHCGSEGSMGKFVRPQAVPQGPWQFELDARAEPSPVADVVWVSPLHVMVRRGPESSALQ